ncbi:S8 family peptidase [Methylobacter sp. YRD-M1]|uniref:S8 family peptidase n=1 Tax=Methylobacter sp. YRD-M1 TaxID=2911520 RepID=UPI00227CB4FD|nr:S8 family serine peptidase [Methylobacter sp. YRD-M1]WAK01109.1 S8 family serine peptidase [Methylobacter sp. YRD-M1]
MPIIVRFSDQLDIPALNATLESEARQKYADPKQRKAKRSWLKRVMMIEKLQQNSKKTTRQLQDFLKSRGTHRKLKPLWAVNSIAAELPADLIGELAALQGVQQITLDAKIQGPVTDTVSSTSNFWNLDATHAPNLWKLGHTGQGVVVASMDTGVDNTHPDLGPKWRGGAHDWFDPYGQEAAPADVNGHGTQVMGLIVGGESGGYRIGMAPDAQWIAAKIFDDSNRATLSGIHAAYQWILDPDGDLNTDDTPNIVNNSWDLDGSTNQCNQEFSQDITLLKEADITVLFSGGNYGPTTASSVSPANNPASVSVGAVDTSLAVDNSSSRGPGACGGGIFPGIVAPGSEIMTTDRMPLFYNFVSGTSFAAVHVSGGMALLKSAFPLATASQLETAVISSAADLGSPGPDNTYGNGMLDVQAAYDWLEANIGNDAAEAH